MIYIGIDPGKYGAMAIIYEMEVVIDYKVGWRRVERGGSYGGLYPAA